MRAGSQLSMRVSAQLHWRQLYRAIEVWSKQCGRHSADCGAGDCHFADRCGHQSVCVPDDGPQEASDTRHVQPQQPGVLQPSCGAGQCHEAPA